MIEEIFVTAVDKDGVQSGDGITRQQVGAGVVCPGDRVYSFGGVVLSPRVSASRPPIIWNRATGNCFVDFTTDSNWRIAVRVNKFADETVEWDAYPVQTQTDQGFRGDAILYNDDFVVCISGAFSNETQIGKIIKRMTNLSDGTTTVVDLWSGDGFPPPWRIEKLNDDGSVTWRSCMTDNQSPDIGTLTEYGDENVLEILHTGGINALVSSIPYPGDGAVLAAMEAAGFNTIGGETITGKTMVCSYETGEPSFQLEPLFEKNQKGTSTTRSWVNIVACEFMDGATASVSYVSVSCTRGAKYIFTEIQTYTDYVVKGQYILSGSRTLSVYHWPYVDGYRVELASADVTLPRDPFSQGTASDPYHSAEMGWTRDDDILYAGGQMLGYFIYAPTYSLSLVEHKPTYLDYEVPASYRLSEEWRLDTVDAHVEYAPSRYSSTPYGHLVKIVDSVETKTPLTAEMLDNIGWSIGTTASNERLCPVMVTGESGTVFLEGSTYNFNYDPDSSDTSVFVLRASGDWLEVLMPTYGLRWGKFVTESKANEIRDALVAMIESANP